MKSTIVVFRYGHRPIRDERVTTHCCLVARAFGCNKIIIHGREDTGLVDTVHRVSEQFGGKFAVEFTESWRKGLQQLKQQGFCLAHLTMYGQEVHSVQKQLKKFKKLAVIIGSQKVPMEVYRLSDYNISVTSQPHSEIAALAVCLDTLSDPKRPTRFPNAKIQITPSRRGKNVTKAV